MNIFDKSAPQTPPQDPLKILQQAEALLSSKERKQGWPYYTFEHGLNFMNLLIKLLEIPSKKATISALRMRQQPQTLRAKISQGKCFVTEKGVEVFSKHFTPQQLAAAKENLDKVQVSVRKVNLIVEILEPVEDMLEALTPIGHTDEEGTPTPFNEETFREELVQFFNEALPDTQVSWEGFTPGAANYARQLAMQDKSVLVETVGTALVVMKLSPELMKGLEEM